MNPTPIVARNLSKSFGARDVVRDLSFAVEPGDVVGLLGKNGAGKTTLLELMLVFTPASSGEVELFGHPSYRLPATAKARIGFVPQQDELINQLTVRDQLRLVASFYTSWDEELISHLCTHWGIDLAARIKSLSVGERQKLSIVLALGSKPDLLILDEPVASLDPVARRRFLEQLVDVSADGNRTVVFSSHIVSDIERLANRIWILKDGQLDWQGDLESLKESIVRIHLRSPVSLPPSLSIPSALSVCRIGSTYATAVVRDWTQAIQRDVAEQVGSDVEVEPLGLEDIFLELHR
jgi:ABC-2 type transport system ATP-binding protein